MRRAAIVLVLLAGAAAIAPLWLSPRPRLELPVPGGGTLVRGAVHVHTIRSDGSGTVEQVAGAAARAGLQFIVFTDHGDGTRSPDAPRYHSGVLAIDAVEISTQGGHVLALGLPRAEYPLGGEARDVLEDVARLGGTSVVAHPGSSKPELRWLEWTAPFDALEWLNADSEWRDETRAALARAALTYPFRRPESLASLLDRPEPVLARWDALTRRRPVTAIAGLDAHARLWSEGAPAAAFGNVVRVPSYEQLFRTFSITLTRTTFTGDAAADAYAVLSAIRAGRVFSSIDGLATPASLEFTAASGGRTIGVGGTIGTGAPAVFAVATNAPRGARITLLRDGQPIATGDRTLQHATDGQGGVYRVEVHLAAAPGDPPVPWILTNPIYVRASADPPPPPPSQPPPTEFAVIYDNGEPDARIERSERSQGALDVVQEVGGTQLSLRYALGGARSENPYVAAVMPAPPGLSRFDRLMFNARASTPMRVSVQLRAPRGPEGERWHRSVYLDRAGREIAIPFAEMTARGTTTERRPPLAVVGDVLFVVDTVNTRPGTTGQIWLDDIRVAR